MNIEESYEFPTVGTTEFDEWFIKLFILMVRAKFVDLTDLFSIDREHWKTYFDSGYTQEEAFAEDLSYYGD